jgi:hypothetical protein
VRAVWVTTIGARGESSSRMPGSSGRNRVSRRRTSPSPTCRLATRTDWLIVGGESGPDARRLDLAWALELAAACDQTSTAFFMKQLGTAVGP